MKKILTWFLLLALLTGMTACGGEKSPSVDMDALYQQMAETLPEMMPLTDDTMMNFCGIDAADCTQAVVVICSNGLRTDEVWLLEAKDSAALDRLKALADARLQAKADETVSYSPDQYLVVQKAELIVNGNYLAMLVSPDVDSLKAQVETAFQ